jgi:hypothetical protein
MSFFFRNKVLIFVCALLIPELIYSGLGDTTAFDGKKGSEGE